MKSATREERGQDLAITAALQQGWVARHENWKADQIAPPVTLPYLNQLYRWIQKS